MRAAAARAEARLSVLTRRARECRALWKRRKLPPPPPAVAGANGKLPSWARVPSDVGGDAVRAARAALDAVPDDDRAAEAALLGGDAAAPTADSELLHAAHAYAGVDPQSPDGVRRPPRDARAPVR